MWRIHLITEIRTREHHEGKNYEYLKASVNQLSRSV